MQGDIKGGISAPTPEASSRKNPAQKIRCQRQGTRQRKAQDKFSCRHALRNHTKKTITAISTDVNKAGPAQGYVPPSCVLPSSVFMPGPSHLLVTDAQSPERGALSPLGYRLANLQDQEVQDQADEDDIHQHPGKNDHIRVIFFIQIFHSGRVPYLPLQSQSLRMYFTSPSTSSAVRVEPQWGINADLLIDGPPSLMTPLRSSSERFSISEESVKLRGSVAKSFVTLIPLPLPSVP